MMRDSHRGRRYVGSILPSIAENVMPWFAWLFLALAFGAVIGSLLMLRDSADKMPLSEEELERMRKRNAELEAKARREDGEDE
jgi:hypothetical protein